MSILTNFLRGAPLVDEFAARRLGLPNALNNICREISALPFQLVYRLLNGPKSESLSAYVMGIATHGGACADKVLLLREVLDRLDIKSEPILGGFGADKRISDHDLDLALDGATNEEGFPHMYHAALLVQDGMHSLLTEASGGRIGFFVFRSDVTQALLKQEMCLLCPNIPKPLYYHRFSPETTRRVIANKMSNTSLICNMIHRVGIAVADRWTLHTQWFENLAGLSEAKRHAPGHQVFFIEPDEVKGHLFWKLFDQQFASLVCQARLAVLKNCQKVEGCTLAFRLEESEDVWGKGSTLVQNKM